MTEQRGLPPVHWDQGPANPEKLGPAAPRHTVTYTRRRFIVVRFSSESGEYSDTLSMAQLTDGYALLADSLDGKPLPPVHGGRLRLVMPTQLGYKSVQFVRRTDVVDHQEKGYWEESGYAVDAPAKP